MTLQHCASPRPPAEWVDNIARIPGTFELLILVRIPTPFSRANCAASYMFLTVLYGNGAMGHRCKKTGLVGSLRIFGTQSLPIIVGFEGRLGISYDDEAARALRLYDKWVILSALSSSAHAAIGRVVIS